MRRPINSCSVYWEAPEGARRKEDTQKSSVIEAIQAKVNWVAISVYHSPSVKTEALSRSQCKRTAELRLRAVQFR